MHSLEAMVCPKPSSANLEKPHLTDNMPSAFSSRKELENKLKLKREINHWNNKFGFLLETRTFPILKLIDTTVFDTNLNKFQFAYLLLTKL